MASPVHSHFPLISISHSATSPSSSAASPRLRWERCSRLRDNGHRGHERPHLKGQIKKTDNKNIVSSHCERRILSLFPRPRTCLDARPGLVLVIHTDRRLFIIHSGVQRVIRGNTKNRLMISGLNLCHMNSHLLPPPPRC